jgi:hypothetical protein
MSAKQRQPNVVFIMADQMAAPGAALLWPCAGEDTAPCRTRREWRRVRCGLLQFADLCAIALFAVDRAHDSVRAACDILSAACTSNGAAPREQSGSAFP